MIAYNRITIIDDIRGDLEFLIHSRHQDINIERLCQKHTTYEAVKSFSPDTTLIMLNAHAKLHQSDLRCRMLGMTLLRSKFRALWRRSEAVVVYSPMNQSEFCSIPLNRIMNTNKGHYFFQIPNWEQMFRAIEMARPIPDEDTLDEIITRYCSLQSIVNIYKHDLQNNLQFKQFKNDSRRETTRLVHELAVLVPKSFHSLFRLEELQQLSDQITNTQSDISFKDTRAKMMDILEEFSGKYSQLPEESL